MQSTKFINIIKTQALIDPTNKHSNSELRHGKKSNFKNKKFKFTGNTKNLVDIPADVNELFEYLSNKNLKEIKTEYYKFKDHETIVNGFIFFVNLIILGLLTYDYFSNKTNELELELANFVIRGLCYLFSSIIIALIFYRNYLVKHYSNIKYFIKYAEDIYIKHNRFNTFIECFIHLIIPFPVNDFKIELSINDKPFIMTLSMILYFFSYTRLYTAINYFRDLSYFNKLEPYKLYSKLTHQKENLNFILKISIKKYGIEYLALCSLFLLLVFSLFTLMFEQDKYSNTAKNQTISNDYNNTLTNLSNKSIENITHHQKYDLVDKELIPEDDLSNFLNCLWFISSTITTIGYGDYYTKTLFGQILSVTAGGIVGNLILSLMTVFMTVIFHFNSQEFKAFEEIKLKYSLKDKRDYRLKFVKFLILYKAQKKKSLLTNIENKEKMRIVGNDFKLHLSRHKAQIQPVNYLNAYYDCFVDESEKVFDQILENREINYEDQLYKLIKIHDNISVSLEKFNKLIFSTVNLMNFNVAFGAYFHVESNFLL